jgi:hypothetical protein
LFFSTIGLKTYFVLGRKNDLNVEDTTTAEFSALWLDETDTTISLPSGSGVPSLVPISGNNVNANANSKKANSLPSILDILDEVPTSSDSNCNLPCDSAPLRSSRSVSQDRKKKNIHYHAQRSQQDELSPLSAGKFFTHILLP